MAKRTMNSTRRSRLAIESQIGVFTSLLADKLTLEAMILHDIRLARFRTLSIEHAPIMLEAVDNALNRLDDIDSTVREAIKVVIEVELAGEIADVVGLKTAEEVAKMAHSMEIDFDIPSMENDETLILVANDNESGESGE